MQKLIIWLIMPLFFISSAHGQGNDTMMQTINLGRLLVDVPKSSNVTGQRYFYVNDLEQKKSPYGDLEGSINSEIRTINKKDGFYQVVKVIEGARKGSKIIVKRAKEYKVFGSELGYELSGFFWINGYLYNLRSIASHDRLVPASEKMLNVIASAQPLKEYSIPEGPGFCVQGAFFPGAPSFEHRETAEIYLRIKGHSDFRIHLLSMTNGNSVGAGLLSRVANKKLPAIFANLEKDIKEIRKGEHSIGAIQGEEILETLPADGGYSIHQFTWQSDGKANDIYAPSIVVDLESGELENGKKVRPSMSDKEAVALFDEIVNSIRVRPIK